MLLLLLVLCSLTLAFLCLEPSSNVQLAWLLNTPGIFCYPSQVQAAGLQAAGRASGPWAVAVVWVLPTSEGLRALTAHFSSPGHMISGHLAGLAAPARHAGCAAAAVSAREGSGTVVAAAAGTAARCGQAQHCHHAAQAAALVLRV